MYRLHAIILCLALAVAAGFAQAPLKAPRSEAGEGWRIAGFSADSLRRALGARPVHELEGLWTDPADGAVVAVMGAAAPGAAGTAGNALLIVAVDTPMVGVGCGTVVGWMSPTARQDYYEARMFTRLELWSPFPAQNIRHPPCRRPPDAYPAPQGAARGAHGIAPVHVPTPSAPNRQHSPRTFRLRAAVALRPRPSCGRKIPLICPGFATS